MGSKPLKILEKPDFKLLPFEISLLICGKLVVVLYQFLAMVKISSSCWQLYKKWLKKKVVKQS